MENLLVSNFNFFSNLSESLLLVIKDKFKVEKIPKGNFIFHESEKATAVYFINEGIVKIKKLNSHGKEVVISIKRKGDSFAEAALFQPEGTLYPATAQALTDVVVGYILKKDLEEIILCSPELSKRMIQTLSFALRDFSTIIKDYTLNDVYGKTVKTLERLGNEYGSLNNCGISLSIDLPLSIQELANIVGSSRETISKIVTKLKAENLLSVKGRTIIINNWNHFCSVSTAI